MDCNMSHYMQPNTGHTEGRLMVTVNTILLNQGRNYIFFSFCTMAVNKQDKYWVKPNTQGKSPFY